MQIVILCGGLATRMYPLTKGVAKSMIEVNGKPFIEHQIELLKKNGIADIVLCVGHMGDQIKNYVDDGSKFGVKVTYGDPVYSDFGTGGYLKKAQYLFDDVFMTMYGDSYLPFDFQKAITFFNENKKLGLMTVYENKNQYGASNVVVNDSLVTFYSKTEKRPRMDFIDYGVSIFRKEALKFLPEGNSDMAELHEALIREKELLAHSVGVRFYEIGSFQGLEDFKNYIS